MQKHIILKVIRKDFVNLHGYKIETNENIRLTHLNM